MNTEINKQNKNYKIAVFAGGCFWCIEEAFSKLEGIIEVVSGFAGGEEDNPTYNQVSQGLTTHKEAVKIVYDSEKISYTNLLDIFWRQIDPTDAEGQFADRGKHYTTAIFYTCEEQKTLAEKSKVKLQNSGIYEKPIVVEIIELNKFFPAEDYHQNYSFKNSLQYQYYKSFSGREQFLAKIWNKKTKLLALERKNMLSEIQYKVTQENATEKPFYNEYWDNKAEGIYVDIVSGEPLFSSTDKFDSGSGWPSFTQAIVKENIIEKKDNTLFMTRIEARSKNADSHLGHIFPDGPKPTGLRYCINSASLRFIPKEKLKTEGYEEYEYLFKA